jgi:hypothetical protein
MDNDTRSLLFALLRIYWFRTLSWLGGAPALCHASTRWDIIVRFRVLDDEMSTKYKRAKRTLDTDIIKIVFVIVIVVTEIVLVLIVLVHFVFESLSCEIVNGAGNDLAIL